MVILSDQCCSVSGLCDELSSAYDFTGCGFSDLKAFGQTLHLFYFEISSKIFPSKNKEYSCKGSA